ncbi:LysR family transcriptional regulator [Microbacterium excoecariae]|uniref:LysR family transcriptional regulator n=1 Tax=Microbacterium excoecariae TaxID=2715210 RepID=UPI0014074D33|nr:LysR substrate-binding domain-containing protein [Microbacterium excoecariae]NHI17979.1 LysR family transcriptional regulator [Microbacterium excoecariae]
MWTDDLTALRSLIAVVDAGSIAQAARDTGYSATAVSRHLTQIEKSLGMTLFERTARSIRASPMARMTADRARLVVEEADYLRRSIEALAHADDGIVRFAYFRAASATLIPGVLSEIKRRSPAVTVALSEYAVGEEVADALRRGEADIGLVWGHPEPDADGLAVEPLLADALLLLTAQDRDDLHENPRDFARLSRESFSSHPTNTVGSPPLVDQLFLTRGLPAPTVTHWITDHAVAKAYAAAGIVISMIPALGISDSAPGVRRSVVVDDFRRIFLATARGADFPLRALVSGAVHDAARAFRGLGVAYVGSRGEASAPR